MIHDCSFVLCWLFMSPLFCFWTVELSTVLQTNPPRSVDSAVFQHFCIFEPFPAVDCMIWDPSFHTEDNWGTQTQLLKRFKHSLMLQRKHDALRAGGWKLLNRMKISNFFLLLKYIFFSIYYCPSKQQKILACFPEDKLSTNLPWSSNSKSFQPPLLMHRVFFWSISECLNLFNSCVWVHQLSSVWKDGSQNHTVTAGKGSNMQKCWKTAESTERGGFVWRTVLSSNCSEQTRDSWTTNTKQKTVLDHPVTSHSIKNQGFPNFWRGLFE